MLIEFWLALAAVLVGAGLAVWAAGLDAVSRVATPSLVVGVVLFAAGVMTIFIAVAGSMSSMGCMSELRAMDVDGDWGYTTGCRVEVDGRLVKLDRVRFDGGSITILE